MSDSPHRDRLVMLIKDLKAEAARVVGAWVEDKGLLVALHYRFDNILVGMSYPSIALRYFYYFIILVREQCAQKG